MASPIATATILKDFGPALPATQPKIPKGRSLEIETGEGLFRVFVCGSQGTGKTAFITRYCQARFPKWYDPIEVAHHSVELISHHKCLFEFIEIDGVEGLVHQAPDSCPEGLKALDALILVYDVGSRSTFSQLAEIYQTIVAQTGKKTIATAVVANKLDMFQESREVSEEEGRELAEAIGAVFEPCSAKEGDGVRNVVKQVMKRAVDGRLQDLEDQDRKKRAEKQEPQPKKHTRAKRSMSGRILSRLSSAISSS